MAARWNRTRGRGAPQNQYKHGDFNRICDRSGFKVKASETRREWNGLIVRTVDWEIRQPQDFVRGVPDHQVVPYPRPEGEDVFVGIVTHDP